MILFKNVPFLVNSFLVSRVSENRAVSEDEKNPDKNIRIAVKYISGRNLTIDNVLPGSKQ